MERSAGLAAQALVGAPARPGERAGVGDAGARACGGAGSAPLGIRHVELLGESGPRARHRLDVVSEVTRMVTVAARTRGTDHAAAPAASVVILVKNGAATLATQLDALAGQRGAPPFEVIVADNGSTDGTRSVAGTFADRLTLRVVDASGRRGPAHARNVGAAAARGRHLLFCDADDRVADRWVGALHRAMEQYSIVTGPTYYVDAPRLALAERYRPRSEQAGPRRYLDRVPFSASNNLGIHADLFSALGGFDPGLQCGEDADLTARGKKASFQA